MPEFTKAKEEIERKSNPMIEENKDEFMLAGIPLHSRFILGSGKTSKYTRELVEAAIKYAGTELISVAIKRYGTEDMGDIPSGIRILPNTLGAVTAEEAIELAHISRDVYHLGNVVKIEILDETRFLVPDSEATLKATKVLTQEGFQVMPYIYPELRIAERVVDAGAVAIMPLASPSGSGRGLATRDFIKVLLEKIDVPIVVDAGISKPSQACEAMEMGCTAVMANTALATAANQRLMAEAIREAIDAGRKAYLSGLS